MSDKIDLSNEFERQGLPIDAPDSAYEHGRRDGLLRAAAICRAEVRYRETMKPRPGQDGKMNDYEWQYVQGWKDAAAAIAAEAGDVPTGSSQPASVAPRAFNGEAGE